MGNNRELSEEKKIEVMHCNCIEQAVISIKQGTLNIKYGPNGTGKSTISKAIKYFVNQDDEELLKLKPYNSDRIPQINNCEFRKVKVFDETYVNRYLFENRNFFDNSYQVFLRDRKLEALQASTESLLKGLQHIFEESEDIKVLLDFLPKYLNTTSFEQGKIKKRGGVGELLKGNGSGCEKYDELNSYRPFFEGREFSAISKWAKWRHEGITQMNGLCCPFCTEDMDLDKINNQNETISKVFKSSALKTANEVLAFLQNGKESGYIDSGAVEGFEKYIGDTAKTNELEAEMNRLGIETEYLYNKLTQLLDFKPMNISREQIEEIETQLEGLTIDSRQISGFYLTDKINTLIKYIDERVKELKQKTESIKKSFLKCQEKMEELIKERKSDINKFFMVAGFPYHFVLKSIGEDEAICYLTPNNADEQDKIEKPEEHLSWGEKNAFSLVMFMFETLSDDADLIILDDPITSFDKNKKFAIIKRLFDNTNFSFKNKTVLMLTHDLQPVIDYVHGKFLRKYNLHTPVYATYLINNNGTLIEREIDEDDLKNIVELTKDLSTNVSIEIPVRLINLRKLIELTEPNYLENFAYDVLSNLIHGRSLSMYQSRIVDTTTEEVIANGLQFINKYISDMDYTQLLESISDSKLLKLIDSSDKYTQTISIRLLFEKDRAGDNLLSQLKNEYPYLCKFINETNHIENDYIFQLNPIDFFEIPDDYLIQLKEFCNSKLEEYVK